MSVAAVGMGSCPSVNSCHKALSSLVDDVEGQRRILFIGSLKSRRMSCTAKRAGRMRAPLSKACVPFTVLPRKSVGKPMVAPTINMHSVAIGSFRLTHHRCLHGCCSKDLEMMAHATSDSHRTAP